MPRVRHELVGWRMHLSEAFVRVRREPFGQELRTARIADMLRKRTCRATQRERTLLAARLAVGGMGPY
jgi:hypothetical protein